MLVVDKEPQPLAVVAAFAAFWQAELALLHNRAEELKIASVTKDRSLLETLVLMVTTLLGCTDAEAMKVVAQRSGTDEHEAALSAELLQVDEAVECLDRNDTDVLNTRSRRRRTTPSGTRGSKRSSLRNAASSTREITRPRRR